MWLFTSSTFLVLLTVVGLIFCDSINHKPKNDPRHSNQKRHLLHNLHHRNKHCHHQVGSFHPNVHKENTSHCLLALSRFSEDEETFLKPYENGTFPYIVLNTGEQLVHHCEYPIFANVGREAFHYLHYILEYYDYPQYFAPLNIFCQIDPKTRQNYDQAQFLQDIERICRAKDKMHLNHGFAYLGKQVQPFSYGLKPNPQMATTMFDFYGLHGVEQPLDYMKFIPGSCFVVSKEQIFTRSYEYYFAALKRKDHSLIQFRTGLHVPLNEENDPTVGHLFERAWAETFHSSCQHAKPWCCTLDCALQPITEESIVTDW